VYAQLLPYLIVFAPTTTAGIYLYICVGAFRAGNCSSGDKKQQDPTARFWAIAYYCSKLLRPHNKKKVRQQSSHTQLAWPPCFVLGKCVFRIFCNAKITSKIAQMQNGTRDGLSTLNMYSKMVGGMQNNILVKKNVI